MTARLLIVNADDFGQSPGINRGVIRAHEHGVVTSASLMVRWPAAPAAARYAATSGELAVGLHVDLGEWVYGADGWQPRYEVVARDDAEGVAAEIERQLERFGELVGRAPTHLDSHQHVHRDGPARSALAAVGERLGIPVRGRGDVRYCGDFYGQSAKGYPVADAITVESLCGIVSRVEPGITELGCHPGEAEPDGAVDTTYDRERAVEVETLCDPRVRQALADSGVRLVSFADVTAADGRGAAP